MSVANTGPATAPAPSDLRPHVVIIGGGFGGLNAAKALGKAPVRVTLIDKRNFHLFQPLLYQVATASLSPSDIAYPIRAILKNQDNTTVLLDEVSAIDLAHQTLALTGGELAYDYLVVAAGSQGTYFGHDEWAPLAPGLKSMEEALDIRQRVLTAFEAAEREGDLVRKVAWLTFVVVGGGPTGVELAGALAEIARQTLRHNFRTFNPAGARIILVEGSPAVLGAYPNGLSQSARRQLEGLAVEVRTDTRVTSIEAGRVTIGEETIAAETVLWGAGVTGNALGASLGVPLTKGNQVPVMPTLTIAGHPNVYVIGDLAAIDDGKGGILPGVAQVAMQGGTCAAKNIVRTLEGKPPKAFHYFDKGTMATIGWNRAVADIGPLHLSGFPAWVIWATIHIAFLVGYRSRFSVMWQWTWAYVTRSRSARLIIGHEFPARGVTAGSSMEISAKVTD
ncbi:MAG: NAD(P)/FAD-dependent oxidoreductase [Chloroflexota bacterium]|nr:NAD(P)/FAD-dependent oxidoreductase [Chloroflexota bacterium]